jgi:hydroxymethylglutaryl-CoA lyase
LILGIKTFIPTKKKIKYLQSLLRVGFDTIDFGSFI